MTKEEMETKDRAIRLAMTLRQMEVEAQVVDDLAAAGTQAIAPMVEVATIVTGQFESFTSIHRGIVYRVIVDPVNPLISVAIPIGLPVIGGIKNLPEA